MEQDLFWAQLSAASPWCSRVSIQTSSGETTLGGCEVEPRSQLLAHAHAHLSVSLVLTLLNTHAVQGSVAMAVFQGASGTSLSGCWGSCVHTDTFWEGQLWLSQQLKETGLTWLTLIMR